MRRQMRMWMWWALPATLVAAPAAAQDKPVSVSFGYSGVHYFEDRGGNSWVGFYGSVTSPGETVGFEADAAYHRDSQKPLGVKVVLNTLTAAVGPRLVFEYGDTKPFVHLLGGLRHDRLEGESSTAFGGMVGGGVEFPAGSDLWWRLGTDLELYVDEGENLTTLRLVAGIVF